MKIFLLNLAINTQDDNFHLSYSYQEKLKLIKDQLIHTTKILKDPQYVDTINQKIRAIFVAPEYFFARSYPEFYGLNIPEERSGRHYNYNDYEEIRKGLTILSKEFPQILIIPGTIAWKMPVKPEVAPPILGTSSFAPVPAWLPGIRKNKPEYFTWWNSLGETPTENSWENYRKETPDKLILKAECLLRKDAGILYGGAGLRASHKEFIVGNRSIQSEAYITELRNINFGLAYNTAFFYLDGKKVAEYSKHSDYQEILFKDAYKELNVALLSDGCSVLEIADLTFGIEICLDHDCDILKNYLARSSTFFTVGDYDSVKYYLEYPEEWTKEKAEAHFFLKESADAYYRFRSFDGTVNKLYYVSRKSGLSDITDFIPIFDQSLQVSYDHATLRINGEIQAAGGGEHYELLSEEKSSQLAQSFNINRTWMPNVHLILSACVKLKESQAKDWFIHSSSRKAFNKPNDGLMQVHSNGVIFENTLVDLESLTKSPKNNTLVPLINSVERQAPPMIFSSALTQEQNHNEKAPLINFHNRERKCCTIV